MGLLSKAGIGGCKMLNNVRNVSVPIANGRSFFVGLLSKAGIGGCKMLNNVRNVSVPIANGRSFFAQNR